MTRSTPTTPTDVATQLVSDNNFCNGFELKDVTEDSGNEIVDRLTWRESDPDWKLAQWGSDYTLAGATPDRPSGAIVRFANEAKSVSVGGPDSPRGQLELALEGSVEWDAPRESRLVQWPHLLVEQLFVPRGSAVGDEGVPSVARVESLPFHVAARVPRAEMAMTEDAFDPDLHTAQFQAFFTVQNRNPDSPDEGDFLWFGVPLYDYRHPEGSPRYAQQDLTREGDKGTEKFIYTVAQDELTDESLHDGAWVTVDRDLLPHVETALETAFDRGYMRDSTLADFAVSGMNLGWEVPGVFDVTAQVADLSLTSVYPPVS